MTTIAEFIRQDMERRGMSLREYADFLGSTHPTVSKYISESGHHVQWDFLVRLSRATNTDIGILARLAAPELAATYEDFPTPEMVLQRLKQIPVEMRRTFLEMIDAYLAQKNRLKNGH